MVDTLDSMFDGRNDVSFDQMANQVSILLISVGGGDKAQTLYKIKIL